MLNVLHLLHTLVPNVSYNVRVGTFKYNPLLSLVECLEGLMFNYQLITK